MNNRGCVFARMGYTGCDGLLDPAHAIPKQRLKQVFKRRGMPAEQIAAAVWDPRIVMPACRHHHHLFDNKVITLKAEQYPPSVHQYALQHEFEYRGPKDGWVGMYVPPEGEAA